MTKRRRPNYKTTKTIKVKGCPTWKGSKLLLDKGFVRSFTVANKENPRRPFIVRVRADKNYGICDIMLPQTMNVPANPESLDKQVLAAYRKAIAEYKAYEKERNDKRSLLLNFFQGKPLHCEATCIHLSNVLYEVMN